MSSHDDTALYDVDIRTPASPAEVKTFCDLLEDNGYRLVTDLAHGDLRIVDEADVDTDGRAV